MPPKEKKTKKTKKTKKKDLKRIEAEKQAKEEEERRLREEEEEKQKLEKQKQEEEAKRILDEKIKKRNEEIERFVLHRKEMDILLSNRVVIIGRHRQKMKESAEWEKLLDCNNALWPDTEWVNLNTYLSMESDPSNPHSLDDAIWCLENVSRLLKELESDCMIIGTKLNEEEDDNDDAEKKRKQFRPRLANLAMSVIEVNGSRFFWEKNNPSAADRSKNNKERIVSRTSEEGAIGFLFWISVGANIDETNDMILLDFKTIMGISIEIPRAFLNDCCNVAVMVYHLPFGPIAFDRRTNDEIYLGNAYSIEIFKLPSPSQPKTINGWTAKSTDHHLDCQDLYPKKEKREYLCDGVKCTMQVPNNIIIPDEPKVAKWDSNDNQWSMDDISDCEYTTPEHDSRNISFKLRSPAGIIGIIQNRRIDLPYKSWSIKPILSKRMMSCQTEEKEEEEEEEEDTVVRLSLCTMRCQLFFDFKQSHCKLVGCDGVPLHVLETILNVPMTPGKLLLELSHVGIHLLPSNSDLMTFPNDKIKSRDIEERICEDIALLSTAYSMHSSPFNGTMGKFRGCYSIQENGPVPTKPNKIDSFPVHLALVQLDSDANSVLEAPGANVLPEECGTVHCTLVTGFDSPCEEASGLDMTNLQTSQSALFISQCIKPLSTLDATKFVESDKNILVTETLKDMLKLTRVFSLC